MRHSVCPLLNRTSTRVGPLSCTSWVYPAAGMLEPREIAEPDRWTTIEPPADAYGVSLVVGTVVGSGAGVVGGGAVPPAGVPVTVGSGCVPPVGVLAVGSELSGPVGVETVGVPGSGGAAVVVGHRRASCPPGE